MTLFPSSSRGAWLTQSNVPADKGQVRYTEYKGEDHGLAWLVGGESSLIPWIFAQRRQ